MESVTNGRVIRNIALIGFMGTGKSSVGRALAYQLQFDYLDTDDLIAERAGKSIPEIFEQDGEAAFRKLEKEVVAGLEQRDRCVISTGGGLGANPDLLGTLKEHALTVCLWASPDTVFERTRHASHRPLLRSENPRERIAELLSVREPVYKQADVLISTELRNVKEVAHQVEVQFRQCRKSADRT